MKRHNVRVALVAVLIVVIGLIVLTIAGENRAPTGRVYALSTVYAGLRQHPQLWAGRTVLIQARLAGIGGVYRLPHASEYHVFLQLVAPVAPPPPDPLKFFRSGVRPPPATQLFAWPHVTPEPWWSVLAWIRGLPLVSQLAPQRWGQVGRTETFRLTLLPPARCAPGQCADSPDAVVDAVYQ